MPDESRVFDVTRPSHVNPSATSKPVIVGHHPKTADPMVNDQSGGVPETLEPTKISFTDDSPDHSASSEHDMPKAFSAPVPEDSHDEPAAFFSPAGHQENPAETTNSPAVYSTPEDSAASQEPAGMPSPTESAFTPIEPEPQPEPPAEPQADTPLPQPPAGQSQPHIEGLQFNAAKNNKRWLKFSIIAIVILLVAAYLAIDSGAIGSGINLPFHIFKQKSASPPPAASTSNQKAASSGPAIPAGFKEYKLAGTSLTFAAPTTWGDPTSTSESGYSKRAINVQSDGTYAYIIDFASNKDVEIAVTSDKFLPPVRTTLYYDYLQWCTGTNDGKFYQSILHFTTANKVDTPTTITCDQGPLSNAQKLDAKTLLWPKVTDSTGKVAADIYIRNLTDPNLAALRVKDDAMTNGNDIKQLLNTVQITAATTNSSANQ